MALHRIRTDRPTPDRYLLENGLVRLEWDLRSEFPFFNFIWLKNTTTGEWRRWCNMGVEAMPVPPPAPPGVIDPPAYNVWLMGHRYTAKELQLSARRAQVRVAYPPPMVVVGELSQLAKGRGIADFPNWPEQYWETLDTMPCSVQAMWSMEAGQPYVDLEPRAAYGELMSIMPMLHHGFCGHDDIPHYLYAGGRFYAAQAPDGSWPSHYELFDDDARGDRAQIDFGAEQVYLFFGSRPGSTAVAIVLHEPHPQGFLFAGRNESPVDASTKMGFFAQAAAKGDWQPGTIHKHGFTDQTLFLEVPRDGRPLPKVRFAFYPDSPLPYGDAQALKAFIAERPELNLGL